MPGVALRNVTHDYGARPILRDLTLEIADGELFVLLGPSGSGKTTALRVIAGLESPLSGSVSIGDRDVTRVPPNQRNVGMVFQSYALFPHLTVAENIAFGLRARRVDPSSMRERTREVAGLLDIGELLDRAPNQLSGGERQRVALARALVRHPDVLLMDEPLSNLDAQLRVRTRAEIVRLQAKVSTTTVHVTHDQTEALGMGGRIGVLRDGLLEQVGTPREVYDHPANLFVGTFVGTPPMNVVGASASDGSLRAGGVDIAGSDAPGSDVLIGVRPEHVHVRGSRWSAQAPEGPAFAATLSVVEPAGDQTLLVLETAAGPLTARVEPAFAARTGDVLEVWLDPQRIHLFDPSTQRALDPR
ncbi:MAG TPA: ABC transporter ATP-binding protein [Actinomycetota bacterium]|nr:ABC transporter ATP-binding protein [Actinomycetota bacterium]